MQHVKRWMREQLAYLPRTSFSWALLIVVCVMVAKSLSDRWLPGEPWNTLAMGLIMTGLLAAYVLAARCVRRGS